MNEGFFLRAQASRTSTLNKLDSKRFAIGAPPDSLPAFTAFRINPGYSINDQQRANVITHCAPALDQPALVTRSFFFAAQRHWLRCRLDFFDGWELTAGTWTRVCFPGRVMRSMCK